ncbi:BZ3501_MvSof-1269-A2-R1_C56g00310 [Microbotryum saponariae]|nr:BZ3501_MvSof-1269-A2-R1_C56g00310 [Microbotryum saponariae]
MDEDEWSSASGDVEDPRPHPSSSHPTVPANDADQHRLDDSLADIAIDAVEDVLYYADAASRLCHYPGPESGVVSQGGKDCFGELFPDSCAVGCVSLGVRCAPDRHRQPDQPVEPAIVRARNVIAWTLPSGRVLRCLIDSGSEVD